MGIQGSQGTVRKPFRKDKRWKGEKRRRMKPQFRKLDLVNERGNIKIHLRHDTVRAVKEISRKWGVSHREAIERLLRDAAPLYERESSP